MIFGWYDPECMTFVFFKWGGVGIVYGRNELEIWGTIVDGQDLNSYLKNIYSTRLPFIVVAMIALWYKINKSANLIADTSDTKFS